MIENSKILIVDDEADIIEFLQFNFQNEGFEVKTANNGKSAVELALEYKPQVILMDVMMPVLDGIEACREIRNHVATYNPLITLLTARGEDYSQLAGFEAGADDYVVKPISPKVLIARTKSLLKMKNGSVYPLSEETRLENDLVINREYYSVTKNRREIQFPRKEFEILSLMASRPNRLFSRDEIFNHIWGADTIVGERTMDVYIRKIRSKIGDNYIKTIKGVGYKFVQ
ncbi:MAG: response regulator transcription factor [Bacteroidales bacterium]|nr:response regulator transcription factor [Bacteroidales bacterium]